MKMTMGGAGCSGGGRARGNHSQGGFTLIEIMITVVIVAILLGVAIPSYQEYIRRSRRTDAKIALMEAAQNMERLFTAEASYENAALGTATAPQVRVYGNTSPDGFYAIALSGLTANRYTLTATPVAGKSQFSDKDCVGGFTINEQGVKGSSPENADVCWVK